MTFTEYETKKYYDKMNNQYVQFWDRRGSLHWGLFEKPNQTLEEAYDNLNNLYIKHLLNTTLLDIGCGTGYVDLELSKKLNIKVVGIDLSSERIKFANQLKKKYSTEIQKQVKFLEASGTKIPFSNESFPQVISQSSIYHIHNKEKALSEIYRVLDKKGLFIFDDLFKPKNQISQNAQINIYNRLLFDTHFNFYSYQEALQKKGFEIIKSLDLTTNLYKTYFMLKKRLEKQFPHFQKLIEQYEGSLRAIDNNEVGWGFFKCQKK